MSTKIQTILFDSSRWESKEARKWLRLHNYKPIKRVHKTDNTLRYKLNDSSNIKNPKFRMISLENGIKALLLIN
jgi:hypothetical protein